MKIPATTLSYLLLCFVSYETSAFGNHNRRVASFSFIQPVSTKFNNPTNVAESPATRKFMVGKGDIFDDADDNNNFPSRQSSSPGTGGRAKFDPQDIAQDSVFEDHIPQLNIVTLVGRVGSAPEPRYFDDGKVVLNVSLAVKRKYHPLERKVRNIKYGEEETDWFALEVWGRDAEYMGKYVSKGARIGITGSLIIDR